jgi:hypothetical protein
MRHDIEMSEACHRVVTAVAENDPVERPVSRVVGAEDGEQLDVPVRRVGWVQTDYGEVGIPGGRGTRPGMCALGAAPPSCDKQGLGDLRPRTDGFDVGNQDAVDVLGLNDRPPGPRP